jgi:hypothetical protein
VSDEVKPPESLVAADFVLPEARVLFIGRNQYNIMQVHAFMKEKGIKAESVYSLKDAIPIISTLKPTHAFISVGFGVTKIDGFAKTFKDSQGVLFYVFPEEMSKAVDAELKSSTIPHKMKMNITGGGVSRIIEAWYKQQYALLPPDKRPKKTWTPKKMKKAGKGVAGAIGSVKVMGGKKKTTDPGKVQHFGGKKKEIEYAKRAEKKAFDGSNVGLAAIAAPGFEGYAIFLTEYTTPLNKTEHRKLGEDIQAKLKIFFTEQAREIPANFELEIKKVDISLDTERFVELLDVEDDGFKLIEGVNKAPTIDPSAEPDMISIEIDRIDPEFPVDFDLYIRMEINNKYVKYVNEGSTLTEDQIEKLMAKSITKVHIKKDDQQKFEQYCNLCFIARTLYEAS